MPRSDVLKDPLNGDITLRTLSAYELIDLLDEWFPHVCIREDQTVISAQRYAGARELIDQMVEIKKDEIENDDDET